MRLLDFVFDHPVITIIVVMVAINLFGSDDPKEETATEVGVVVEDVIPTEKAVNVSKMIDDIKTTSGEFAKKATKQLHEVLRGSKSKTAEEIAEKKNPVKHDLNTATIDNPYGKIGNKY